jgi:two-component system, OmpR family, sensor kinase
MFYKSIRFKIVLWYMGLLTLTLLIFSTLVYQTFKKALYDDLDDLIGSRAEGIVNAISTYAEIKKIESAESGKLKQALITQDADSFVVIASDWVIEKSRDPSLMSIYTQILNEKGEKIVSSKNMPHIQQISGDDFKAVFKGEDSYDTVSGELNPGQVMPFRMYSRPVMEDGKVKYVVQVISSPTLLYVALNGLKFPLFILLPITVIATGIAGMFLAGLTLRPVDSMIHTLKQITAENLKLKIHLPDTKDEIKRLADTFNDMIERLEKSFSSQQEFIEEVSHELRTPLTILKGELELALKKLRSPEEYEAVLVSSLEEIGKMSRVIEDLLVLARFDNNQMTLEIRRINLGSLINRTIDDMKVLAEQKDIEISLSSQENLILDGDENQLRRLLVNLLDNAIKYTSRKGKVTVTSHKDGTQARVVVSDTGIGIPADELPYIFDRFYQVARSRRTNHGFGLGLSIAKSIAESHHGKILVESHPGQGTTFTVSLPLSYPV